MQFVIVWVVQSNSPVPGLEGTIYFVQVDHSPEIHFCSWNEVIRWMTRVHADLECKIFVKMNRNKDVSR